MALLDWVESELERCSGEESRHGAIAAVAEQIQTGALPLEPFGRLIAANRRDQDADRLRELRRARWLLPPLRDPVGELVLHVFGAATPERIALSDRVCAGAAARRALPGRARGPRAAAASTCPPRTCAASTARVADLGAAAHRRHSLRELIRLEVDRASCTARRGRASPSPAARAGAARGRRLSSAAGGPRSTRSRPPTTTSSRRAAEGAGRPPCARATLQHVGSSRRGARRAARVSRRAARRAPGVAASFYAGIRLLPATERDALFAIYALARRIDDIADGELPPAAKLERLDAVRDELAHVHTSDDPVLVAVADASSRYPIPLAAFGELVDGAELDVRGTEYATFEQLELYCRCVAGSIGRLALGVFDCSDRAAGEPLADDLGLALQLGNILRDLAEDVPERPRLPAAGGPRAFRLRRRRRSPRRAGRAADRVRGRAWAGAPRPRARSRAAARPPQRVVRARDDGRVRPSCSSASPPTRSSCCAAGSRSPAGRRGSCSPAASCTDDPRGDRRRRPRRPRGRARVHRRGRERDALRGPLAARRRHLLGRARRALARQRPAHRAPLLHRLPRLPRADRVGAAAAGAASPARAGAARGPAPGLHHAQRPPRAAPPRRVAAALRSRSPRGSACRRCARPRRCGASTPTTPPSTSRASATGCAHTGRARTRSRRSGT